MPTRWSQCFRMPGRQLTQIQPELEFSEDPPFPPGEVHKASNPEDLRALVRATAGCHFELTEKPQGSAKRLDYLVGGRRIWVWTVSVGPVRWRALGRRGTFSGGGKVAFNCETTKFLRSFYEHIKPTGRRVSQACRRSRARRSKQTCPYGEIPPTRSAPL